MHHFPIRLLAGLLAFTAGAHAAETNLVTLTVEPLRDKYFDAPLEIRFKYTVARDLPDGTAEVRLHNADSGQTFIKPVSLKMGKGEHAAYASWGGDLPDGTLSGFEVGDLAKDAPDDKADDFVAGLFMDKRDSLPDGLYLPEVTIKAADGAVLAEFRYTADQARQMRVTGTAARKISKATVDAKSADLKKWHDELAALEAKARAAGADISLPHLMVAAMRETVKQTPGRVGGKEYDVVFVNHAYAARQVPATKRQLEALAADPKSGVPADIRPRPAGRMAVSNGYFHADGKPVFMVGLCLFALWPDLPLMREFGYNLVHVGASPGCVFPDSEEPTGTLRVADYNPGGPTMRAFLDQCAALGIKVDLGLNMHPLPEWFLAKYPDARLEGHSVAGFIPFDIEHPEAIRFTEKFFDAAMREVANHPALNSIWLANEPTMLNFGPISARLFREHLATKYGTVEKLNAMWGVAYASFDEVKIGSGPEVAKTPAAQADFWWFNLGRLTRYFEFMQACVRKYDKTVPTCFKLNNLQMGWYCPAPNVDQEGVTDISQVTGMDSGTYPFAKPYYDWLRSLSPEKPVVNLEFKGGGIRTRLDLWKGALHGLAGIDWWCWHPKPSFSGAMCYTEAMHEGALAAYNIQRLLPQVMAFQEFPRSPFVVLYPDPVLPRAWHYFQVHTPVVNAIKMMGYAVDYATEKRIADGRLERYPYPVIVLPAADCIRSETLARVEAFVRRGGVAVTVGGLPVHDEMGRERDLGWLKAPADATPAFGDPTNGVTFACGKGTVWMLPAAEEKTLLERLDAVARKVLPPQPLVIRDVENRTIPWTNAKGESVFLTFLLNEWLESEYAVTPRFQVPMESGIDLITGEPVDPGKPIVLPPAGVRLIEWTPAKR